MTKRNNNFTDCKRKRSKLEDDLWNDDSNFEDLEECLMLATQVCEEHGTTSIQQNNETILPNYDYFKETHKRLYTSTQKDSYTENIPSCSIQSLNGCENNITINRDLLLPDAPIEVNEQIKNLREKCQYKDGEISILRVQLKESKQNLEQEYQKKEKDWLNKINIHNKKISAIKSELDFKNLEIMNLKNSFTKISKVHMASLEPDFLEKVTAAGNSISSTETYKLKETFDVKHPFIYVDFTSLHIPTESQSFTTNLNFNQSGDERRSIYLKHQNICNCNRLILEKFSVPTAQNKMQFQNNYVNQILDVATSALAFFYNYLLIQEYYLQNTENLCEGMQIERLKGSDNLNLLILDAVSWCDKEVEIRATSTTNAIAGILPHSYYLQKALSNDRNSSDQTKNIETTSNYLNCIKMIMKIINRTGKSLIAQRFLGSIATLLFRISQTEAFTKSELYVLEITKELILAKPSVIVLKQLLLFLKQATIHINFLGHLCKAPCLKSEERELCMCESFMLLNKKIFELENMNVIVIWNSMQFISNLLNYNPLWLRYDENRCCNCICEINALGVTAMYELVKNYKEAQITNGKDSGFCREALRNCVKLLHIISFKYFDIVNKHGVDSQCKFVSTYLYLSKDELQLNEFENEALGEIGMQNNCRKINSTHFDKIPIWN